LFQYSIIITGSGRLTAISPTSPGPRTLPPASITSTRWPGAARPMEAGLTSMIAWQLATTRLHSVWP